MNRTVTIALVTLPIALVALAFVTLTPRPGPERPGGALRLLRQGAEAELSGPLSLDLAARLDAAFAQPTPPRLIQLDSPGGTQAAAARIARSIRTAQAETAVTDRCLSACVAVFMAGAKRWIGPFATIGLEPGDENLAVYRSAGMPDAFIREAADTSLGQAWSITAADLLHTGIATGAAGPEQFALGGFGAAPTRASIRARLLRIPLYAAAAAEDPAAFDVDLDVWTDVILAGEPGTRAFNRTRAMLGRLFQRALPRAPDNLLVQHANLFVDELNWMQRHLPGACPAWAQSRGGVPGPTDDDLAARRHALMLAILATKMPTDQPSRPPVTPAEDCATLLRVWLAAQTADDVRRLLNDAPDTSPDTTPSPLGDARPLPADRSPPRRSAAP